MNSEATVVASVMKLLWATEISYMWIGATALRLQGVQIQEDPTSCAQLEVQWDQMETAHDILSAAVGRDMLSVSSLDKQAGHGSFRAALNSGVVEVVCFYNTVVATDAYRIQVPFGDHAVWLKSLYFYLAHPQAGQAHGLAADAVREIRAALAQMQRENTALSLAAWNEGTYDAWVARHGTPVEAAGRITQNPQGRLAPLYDMMAPVAGKRVINLLGSHGTKGVALAHLGADVTVVDFSSENARYANALASAAGVRLNYVVCDVLDISADGVLKDFDLVLMELGVLHYFVDLTPLMTVVANLLHSGGRFLLHDFHPISTKLVTSTGKKHRVTGNYFDPSLIQTPVAFSKHTPDAFAQQPTVQLRKWTLGDIVTAVASSGLRIETLSEEPNHKRDDIGLPKTFTLVAQKL